MSQTDDSYHRGIFVLRQLNLPQTFLQVLVALFTDVPGGVLGAARTVCGYAHIFTSVSAASGSVSIWSSDTQCHAPPEGSHS